MTAVNPIPPAVTPAREPRPYEPSMEEILASIRRIIADDQSLPGRSEPDAEAPAEEPVVEHHHAEIDALAVHVLRPVSPPYVDEPMEAVETRMEAQVVKPSPAQPERAPEPIPAPHERAFERIHEVMQAPVPPSFVAHGTIAPQYPTPSGPRPVETQAPAVPEPRQKDQLEAQVSSAPSHNEGAVQHHAEPLHDSIVDDDAAYEAAAAAYDEPLGRHEPIPFEPAPLFSHATDQSVASAFNTLAATRLADNSDDLLSMTREMIRPMLKTWLDENLPNMVERLVRAEIERVARGGR